MNELKIDCRRMKTREKAHEYLAGKKLFPKEYGRNLDALYDVLTSFADVRITVKYSSSLKSNLGEYGEKMLTVFCDAAKSNDSIVLQII